MSARVLALLLTGASWATAATAQTTDAIPNEPATAEAVEGSDVPSLITERTGEGDVIVTARRFVPSGAITASKTTAPLIETPQSVSVIGSEEIRDREARTIVEATRYSSGVLSETFGNDTRNDFLQIRGFPAQATGYFLGHFGQRRRCAAIARGWA